MAERAQITVTGVVQGVGFRPFVFNLATGLGLTGHVTNTTDGVLIEVEGPAVPEFIRRLPIDAPPLARITGISIIPLPFQGTPAFSIQSSKDSAGSRTTAHISPDTAVCADCLREMSDPADRRYRYPFINCTNCGPRYTITRAVPYDRPNTTMASFGMCPACSKEYHDPADRRFHAQPNACPTCGPTLLFKVQSAKYTVQGAPMEQCIDLLKQGGIAAIKGIGGYHLACDALNDDAVRVLRARKRKSNKPFALMAPSLEVIDRYCEVSPDEQFLLLSPKRPIVLLKKKAEPQAGLSEHISPHNQFIGWMLPYTPLHYLLFQPSDGSTDPLTALVMTSGNLSEEPIIHTNNHAERRLDAVVDGFLMHDRDIFMPVDDSVIRVMKEEWRGACTASRSEGASSQPICRSVSFSFIRRARGYAPEAIALRDSGPSVLGCGADLKNTFTLTTGPWAIPSQHIGDMENYETLRFYEECLASLRQVYRVDPVAIAHDLHPGYLSTRWAIDTGARSLGSRPGESLPMFGIQHHYAHIGSVMAEHGLTGPVIGVAFDGTGYGTDGNLWGGELLIADTNGFQRVAQLRYVPLPGGEAAIREPWRTAVSFVADAYGAEAETALRTIGFLDRYGPQNIAHVMQVASSRDLSPLSSGAGRLFDAVAALLGVCDRNTFEGEAAMALEALAQDDVGGEYPVVQRRESGYTVMDFSGMIKAIVDDLSHARPLPEIASQFHNTVAAAIRNVVTELRAKTGIDTVAVSGGTFQNVYLKSRIHELLRNDGLGVLTNVQMPPNDACISLGQAYIVRERLKRNT